MGQTHRQTDGRIAVSLNAPHYNKYLETRRPIATAADRVATDHLHKSQSQYGGLPEFLLAYSCPEW